MASSSSNSNIPVYFTPAFFKTALESGLRLTNLKIYNVNIRDLTVGGENYCSNIYGATIRYENKCNEQQDNEICLIIKSMPVNKQGALSRLNIYCKETLFYLDIKPKMDALMWHIDGSWKLGARHFYSTTEPEQTIIFEDLCMEGFQLKSRQIGLDKTHATAVMQKLGEYHALTMVMAEKEPDIIVERFPYGLLNIETIKTDAFKALFGAQLFKLAKIIDNLPGYEAIAKKLINYNDNFTERVLKSVYPLLGEINVLNHGDLWVNNIFFKYDDSKNLEQTRFIDFQLCYYGSPGFDINYFLNTSIQLDVLRHHRHSLIGTYYDALVRTLEKLPFNKPLPKYEQILDEIRQHEAYGFVVAFAFFPLMSMVSLDSQDNSLENFHDAEFALKKIELMFVSNERTMEILKYTLQRLNDLGILD